MATRSYTDVVPTADTIALNAFIFGFSGHSLVTPHSVLRQLWWTERKIQTKVNRSFVISKLKGVERQFLDKPLAFGEGLTDDTYMEWILGRAKRFFLILSEIGVPDQIFGCIDDSWDDDDLPLSLESIPSLELSYDYDPVLNKKFYDTQFIYLLRELKAGSHIDYGPREHIPLEALDVHPPAVALQVWDRVTFPGRPDDVYVRRKFALHDKETRHSYKDSYLQDIEKAQSLRHEHIASVWSSYTTFEGSGYVLSDFVGEHTLGSFIDHRKPVQFARLRQEDRPVLLWEWMHCLVDALAFLHCSGEVHSAIRPSNIIIDRANRIAFSDVGSIKTLQRGKRVDKKEVYDYAAPGTESSKANVRLPQTSPPLSSASAFSKLRKFSSSGSTSSESSISGGDTWQGSAVPLSPPATPPLSFRSPSVTSLSKFRTRNYSHLLRNEQCPYPNIPFAPRSPPSPRLALPVGYTQSPDNPFDMIQASPASCDIYSLACVYLDILTFMLQGKRTEFVKFRQSTIPATKSSSTRSPRSQQGPNASKPDTSFHANPTKIFTWLDILDAEADKRPEQVYRGVPATSSLLRRMLSPNPELRPPAVEVRDTLAVILLTQCQISHLCCADRVWEPTLPALRLSEEDVAITVEHDARGPACAEADPHGSDKEVAFPPYMESRPTDRGLARGLMGGVPASNRLPVPVDAQEECRPVTATGGEEGPKKARRHSNASSKIGMGWKKAFSRNHEPPPPPKPKGWRS